MLCELDGNIYEPSPSCLRLNAYQNMQKPSVPTGRREEGSAYSAQA